MKKMNLFRKPKTLTSRQKRKLKEQFPMSREYRKYLEEMKNERIKNKIETTIIVVGLAIVVLLLYVLYLMVTYQW